MSKTKSCRVLPLLAASWFLICGGGSCTDSSDDGPDYVPGEVLVRFMPGTTQSEVETLASDLGLEVGEIRFDIDSPADLKWAIYIVPVGEELDWIPVIEESPIVSYADLNGYSYGGRPPSCSEPFGSTW